MTEAPKLVIITSYTDLAATMSPGASNFYTAPHTIQADPSANMIYKKIIFTFSHSFPQPPVAPDIEGDANAPEYTFAKGGAIIGFKLYTRATGSILFQTQMPLQFPAFQAANNSGTVFSFRRKLAEGVTSLISPEWINYGGGVINSIRYTLTIDNSVINWDVLQGNPVAPYYIDALVCFRPLAQNWNTFQFTRPSVTVLGLI